MPKISVIVPIFNVAPYIQRCAKSLFEQTIDDIEIIFIDDCSPDNSMALLNEEIERYRNFLKEKKIRVRESRMPSNGGQAAVRRQGLLLAEGDYVIHCDSDDWVDTSLYEEMYAEAVRVDADVVICPIRDEYVSKGITRPMEYLGDNCQDVLQNWYRNPVGMFSWNKLVKRKIYIAHDLLPFEGVNMWEDNGMMLRVFYFANKLAQTSNAVYHYNQANTSAMTNGYGRKAINQMISCARQLDIFFREKKDYKSFEKTNNAIKFLAKLNLVTSRFSWLKEFYSLFPESNTAMSYIPKNTFSKKGYLRFLFVKYHLSWLFVILFKLRKLFT